MEYPIIDTIPIFPIIKNFKENHIFKAFILAGIFQTIVLSLTLSTHKYIDKKKINGFLKWLLSVIYIFLLTVISYTIMYLIFGYGSSMVSKN